jgi:hypothetical protein
MEAKPSVEAAVSTVTTAEAPKAAWVEATVATAEATAAESAKCTTVEAPKTTAVESAEPASFSARCCRYTERSSRQKSNSKLSHIYTTLYTVPSQCPAGVRCRTDKGRYYCQTPNE